MKPNLMKIQKIYVTKPILVTFDLFSALKGVKQKSSTIFSSNYLKIRHLHHFRACCTTTATCVGVCVRKCVCKSQVQLLDVWIIDGFSRKKQLPFSNALANFAIHYLAKENL